MPARERGGPYRCRNRHATMKPPPRVIRQIAGWSLIAFGMLMGLVPMVPGSLLIAIGVVLLAPHVRAFRRVSAWMHKRFPHLRGPLRPFRAYKQRRRQYGSVTPEPDPNQNGLANRGPAPQSGAGKQDVSHS